jgi:hypothetical protein
VPARLPDLPEFPAAGHQGNLRFRVPPPGQQTSNRNVDGTSGKQQLGNGGKLGGWKFTGGMGVPLDRSTVEGALSPYQQPNGNTSAAQSSNLINGIEEQGMHFGFELQY